ncbi:MAG: DUF4124 domain-containing protein [Gammaproteobacteria bacterium]|nr:DUF4124 domain-containing protein [Gammaproteobacteria bacterium]
MSRILAFSLCCVLAVGAAEAGKIVKYTLKNGDVIYSDTPPPEAVSGEDVTVEPLQTFSAPAAPRLEGATSGRDEPEEAGYEEFKVTSPENDSTIRDNGGNVRVSLSLSPGLQSGHSIEIFMDGQAIGSGSSTSLTLTDVDRGTHTVRATVKDAEGKEVVRSNSVIFHLRRGGV